MKNIFRWLCKLFGWPSAFVFFKPKIMYEDKKHTGRNFRGSAIIAANHGNALDFIFFILLFFCRDIHCLVGETLYGNNRFLRFWLNVFGSVKVDRISKDMSFLSKTDKILSEGGVVEVFPEGRFNNGKDLLPFTPTAVYMSLKTGAPIIPVYHACNYGIFKRERVVVGKKIYMRDYAPDANPDRETINNLTDMLRDKIMELKTVSEQCEKKKKSKAEKFSA